MSAICLERKPIVIGTLNEIEKKMNRLLQEIEMENSYKSDHEMKQEFDK